MNRLYALVATLLTIVKSSTALLGSEELQSILTKAAEVKKLLDLGAFDNTSLSHHRNVQQEECSFLLGALGGQIPNSEEICECSGSLALTCEYDGICVGGICTETVDITVDVSDGVLIRYCSDFVNSLPFEDTCFAIGLSLDGKEIESCEDATYGSRGSTCSCQVCPDGASINLDCSQHSPFATTDGCQAIDVTQNELLPVIPHFQDSSAGPPPTPRPTRRPATPPPTPKPTQPAPDISTDTSCPVFALLGSEVPNGSQVCGCSGNAKMDCFFRDVCPDNENMCADSVALTVDMSTGINMIYCVDFVDDLERTCVDYSIDFDRTINACNSVTYGTAGECRCEVCDNGDGISIDCSDYNPFAKTDGCQDIPEQVGPIVPAFQKPSGSGPVDIPVSRPTSPPDTTCTLYSLLSEQIPKSETICNCKEDNSLDCAFDGICAGEVCANTLDLTYELDSGIKTTYCADYQDDLENTCVDVTLNFDGTLNSCNGATYGGSSCSCTVCNNGAGLNVDCSDVTRPFAKTDGCQTFPTDPFSPYLPAFQKPYEVVVGPPTPTLQPTPPAPTKPIPQDKSCAVYNLLAADFPNGGEKCGCDDQTTLFCYFGDRSCTNGGGMCADSVDVTVGMAKGINVVYCTDFADNLKFEETCIDTDIGFDRKYIACNGATYGDKSCRCEVCDGGQGLDIDCSMHNPAATTNGCSEIEKATSPFVPHFQMPSEDFQPSDIVVLDIPDDKTCPVFSLLAADVNDAAQFCGCDSVTNMLCQFMGICTDGVCSDAVELTMSLDEGIHVKNCANFINDYGFDDTCFDVTIGFDEKISTCKSITYGGQPCRCDVCDDQQSLNIDCSEYNPDATTNGCQKIAGKFGPIVPAYQVDDKTPDDSSGKPFEGTCEILNFMKTRANDNVDVDEICQCKSPEEVDCDLEDVCENDMCADDVDISIDISKGLHMENCVSFQDKQYEDTCIYVGMGTLSLKLDDCESATYGGKPCQCRVCDDSLSIEVDCSAHNPRAITPEGCQEVHIDKLTPFIPAFGTIRPGIASANGSSSSGLRISNSLIWLTATTMLFVLNGIFRI